MRIHFSKETIIKLKEKLKIAEEFNNMRLYKIIWCLIVAGSPVFNMALSVFALFYLCRQDVVARFR